MEKNSLMFCKVFLIPVTGPVGKDLRGLQCNQGSLAFNQGLVNGLACCLRSERASMNVLLLPLVYWSASFCYFRGSGKSSL